jgi:hypothetical protein
MLFLFDPWLGGQGISALMPELMDVISAHAWRR